jgi:hypothetical protein
VVRQVAYGSAKNQTDTISRYHRSFAHVSGNLPNMATSLFSENGFQDLVGHKDGMVDSFHVWSVSGQYCPLVCYRALSSFPADRSVPTIKRLKTFGGMAGLVPVLT